jgi:hypothetical protein
LPLCCGSGITNSPFHQFGFRMGLSTIHILEIGHQWPEARMVVPITRTTRSASGCRACRC